MPKVTISPQEGVVIEQGTGFILKDIQIQEPQYTDTTFKGAQYSFTAVAESGDNYDGTYFTMYAQDGTKYGVWVSADGGSEPTDATVDTWIPVAFAAGASANTAAANFASDIDSAAGTVFEAVATAAAVVVYVLQTGELTSTGGENVDCPVTSFAEADGAGSLNSLGNSQIALASAGDVATVAAEIPLADGTVPGQMACVHVSTAASAGSILLTGNFSAAGNHTRTKATFGGADNDEYVQLMWTGTDWANISNDGITYS